MDSNHLFSLSDNLHLLIIIAVVLFFLIKKLGEISPAKAKELLAKNALVIDVRSPEEFASGKIPNAINIPLGSLAEEIEKICGDKNKPLLLHCLSGSRSAIGVRILKGRSYSNVHNLGSFYRARSIVEDGLRAEKNE